jgi:hypothetical protein
MKCKDKKDTNHHSLLVFEADAKARRLSGFSIFGKKLLICQNNISKCLVITLKIIEDVIYC